MKLFVNDPRYDNVGAVLSQMGQGFEYSHASRLFDSDPRESVLFINCGGPVPCPPERLAAFVQAGGTVYASDLQAPLVAQIYPEILEVAPGGSARTVTASVVDQGLQACIGHSLSICFDMSGWQHLRPRHGSVRTYIQAEKRPLVVSYQRGTGGTLFFTAFHNVKQTSKEEQELLRFLIFRPILSQQITESVQSISAQDLSIEREYTGGLRADLRERTFAIPRGGSWRCRISWAGQGRVGAAIMAPGGEALAQAEGWTGPLELAAPEVPDKSCIRLRYLEVVQKELPFFIHLTAGGMAAPVEAPAPVEGTSRRLRGSLVAAGRDGRQQPAAPGSESRVRGTLLRDRKL